MQLVVAGVVVLRNGIMLCILSRGSTIRNTTEVNWIVAFILYSGHELPRKSTKERLVRNSIPYCICSMSSFVLTATAITAAGKSISTW